MRRLLCPEPSVVLAVTPKSVARLLYWQRLLTLAQPLPGVIVECGVGCGDSLVMIGSLAHAMQIRKPIIAFDSFQGLPRSTDEDGDYQRGREGMLAFSEPYIRDLLKTQLGDRHGIQLRAGWFDESLIGLPWKIALLHLDCDLYASYRVCLERLTPLLLHGSVIAVDEYVTESLRWPGAQKAIDAWCAQQGWIIRTDDATGKCFIVVP